MDILSREELERPWEPPGPGAPVEAWNQYQRIEWLRLTAIECVNQRNALALEVKDKTEALVEIRRRAMVPTEGEYVRIADRAAQALSDPSPAYDKWKAMERVCEAAKAYLNKRTGRGPLDTALSELAALGGE